MKVSKILEKAAKSVIEDYPYAYNFSYGNFGCYEVIRSISSDKNKQDLAIKYISEASGDTVDFKEDYLFIPTSLNKYYSRRVQTNQIVIDISEARQMARSMLCLVAAEMAKEDGV